MKSKPITVMFCVLAVACPCWVAQAGDLEPPGSPDSTMVTLQQIYEKLDDCTGGGLRGVPKTGQTGCWAGTGEPISCPDTGQDGEYQAGATVTPRFTVNGDGTVTDNLTSLIWLQNANCFGTRIWADALTDANFLQDGLCGLTDGSADGDWRLPNVRELSSLSDFGRYNPALPASHPFSNAQGDHYWSSTTWMQDGQAAWRLDHHSGNVFIGGKGEGKYVWPVRGGR